MRGPYRPVLPMKLTVLIPAYNERHSIAQCLVRVVRALPEVEKEIIIVDDCSTDGTGQWLQSSVAVGQVHQQCAVTLDDAGSLVVTPGPLAGFELRVLRHASNRGKGGALQTALGAATGEVLVIQDADLEYDPDDWREMYDLIALRRVADVVYGCRFAGRTQRALQFHHYLANRVISLGFSLLYDQALRDVETCYKMFTREVKDSLRLTANDFGCEIELSAQIVRARRWRIYETAICYFGRTHAEGKKINWRDGVKALWYLVRYRF